MTSYKVYTRDILIKDEISSWDSCKIQATWEDARGRIDGWDIIFPERYYNQVINLLSAFQGPTKELVLEGIHPSNKPTTDKDARRIATKATNNFLTENKDTWEIGDLMYQAWLYEQMVYASATRLKLTCEPLDEEIRIAELEAQDGRKGKKFKAFNPLKIVSEPHCYRYPWKGPFIIIKGKEGESGERVKIGRLNSRARLSKVLRHKQRSPRKLKKRERLAVC